MTWPQPTREDHDKFCRAEGWIRIRDAKGRAGTQHVTYELHAPDGTVLRTRISHPVNRDSYGRSLWAHILRDQLNVTEEVFWACVRGGILPDRGIPATPAGALPADLVHLLLTRVGLTEAEVAQLTKAEAIERMQRYWQDPR